MSLSATLLLFHRLTPRFRGDIALVTRSTFGKTDVPWTMERLWRTNHVGVVRSVLWDERVRSRHSPYAPTGAYVFSQNNILLTGGEDSKLNAWSYPARESSSDQVKVKREGDGDDMDIDKEDRSPTRKKKRT